MQGFLHLNRILYERVNINTICILCKLFSYIVSLLEKINISKLTEKQGRKAKGPKVFY